MTQPTMDAGVILVLLDRLEKQRLPRMLALKDKVDGGQPLGDFDIEFLEEILMDTGKSEMLIKRHPEYQAITARVIHLYFEITTRALENEQHPG